MNTKRLLLALLAVSLESLPRIFSSTECGWRAPTRPAPDADATATREAILALGRCCEIIQADCGRPAEAAEGGRETESRLGSVNGGLTVWIA